MSLVTRMLGRGPRAAPPPPPPRPRQPPPPSVSARIAGGPNGVQQQVDQQQALREVFTPTRPQRSTQRVAGRQVEMQRVLRAVALDRAHVVLYGERGRGKTSLVNLVAMSARTAGYMVGRFACASDSKFDEIMRGLTRDLPASLLAVPVNHAADLEGCEAALPDGRVQPRDVAALPGRLAGRHLLLIVDEFDRVEDDPTRTRFADTIKQVSDRGVPLSFIIVGVSDSLEELLGRHPSIQRNILGLPLPLLADNEIDAILLGGARHVGLEYPADVRTAIIALARGVPYIAQLLGLHAGSEAIARGATRVNEQDLLAAFQRAADEVDPRLAVLYEMLTQAGRDVAMRAALREIAGGEQDRFARFAAVQDGHLVLAAGRQVRPEYWHALSDAGVIRPCPSAGPAIFTFADAIFPHYVLLREALDGLA